MQIETNVQLKPYNSFRTEATARLFCQPETIDEVKQAVTQYPNENKLILGQGCNLFFTKDYDGLIINPRIKGVKMLNETNQYVEIEVGAAEDWDEFVAYCVERNWSGIENLSYIPGSVGAAPIQNIGAYGAEVKDVITKVNTIDTTNGEVVAFDTGACQFDYRNSLFKQTRRYIITSVVFRLSKTYTYVERYRALNEALKDNSSPTLMQVREAVIKVRQSKLPDHRKVPNAGSFFKNPIIDAAAKEKLVAALPNAPLYDAGKGLYKTSAAYLIDQAGYKGKRNSDGTVGTSEKHALIIVNHGTGRGVDIANFVKEIQQAVAERYSIDLEPEVWIF